MASKGIAAASFGVICCECQCNSGGGGLVGNPDIVLESRFRLAVLFVISSCLVFKLAGQVGVFAVEGAE